MNITIENQGEELIEALITSHLKSQVNPVVKIEEEEEYGTKTYEGVLRDAEMVHGVWAVALEDWSFGWYMPDQPGEGVKYLFLKNTRSISFLGEKPKKED